ncbi:MAG: SO2930 family diheme c-type cytochrome [Bacteroidia bacterium]|nr:SO2930 family diheme c-type cytochrome [Bacteroidia bacterium]
MRLRSVTIWCNIFCLLLISCGKHEIAQEDQNPFFEKLSEHKFFVGELADLKPAEGVLPYELNTPLFTDYAHKERFVKVASGKEIRIQGEELIYPEGTYLIKNFYYWKDEQDKTQGRQLIESRVLHKTGDLWEVANYEWDAEQKEAYRNILGAKKEIAWTDTKGQARKVSYVIPDNNDCKSCHKYNGNVKYIGPKLRNLNKEIAYSEGSMNQLQKFQQMAWLPASFSLENRPKLPNWEDDNYSLGERARAYLDVNCAHCHSQHGPASNTALFLEYEEEDAHRLGINKGPVSAAQGSGNLMYNITPGKADSSILVYRMNSVETGIAMPEIGRNLIHEEGVALMQDWINSLR